MSSWKTAGFLFPEVSEFSASQEDVRHGLLSFSAVAHGIRHVGYSSIEEEALESYLLGS